jgi:hypothetical protein
MLSDRDYETETYTRFCKNDSRAYLYSADKPWITRMKKWASDYPKDVVVKIDNKAGMEVEFPIEWFAINPPKKERKKRVANYKKNQR